MRALAVSLSAQELEARCLQRMEVVAREHGWQIDALLFDGGLLRKREDAGYVQVLELLRAMEAAILAQEHLHIELAIKPWPVM